MFLVVVETRQRFYFYVHIQNCLKFCNRTDEVYTVGGPQTPPLGTAGLGSYDGEVAISPAPGWCS